MRYQITSDSTCDLSPEQLERYNIRLLPLYVSMDGKTLRDGVDVKPDDIYGARLCRRKSAADSGGQSGRLCPRVYRVV